MKDLKRLMVQKTRLSSLELLEEQIKAERLELLRHKRNVERLELARSYYRMESDHFGTVYGGECLPVSEKREDYFDTVMDWFQAGKEDPDKIICYLNGEYDLTESLDRPQSAISY